MTPTLKDIHDEIKTTYHHLNDRLDMSDKERKKLGDELTSKTGQMSSEYRNEFDKLFNRINALEDLLDKHRIDSLKTQFGFNGTRDSNRKSAGWQSFMKAIKSGGNESALTEEEKSYIYPHHMPAERKALYSNDAATGGFLAPSEFINELQQYQLLISPLRQICRIQRTSAPKIEIPALTDDTSAYWASEQSAFTDSADPKFGLQEIPTHEMRGLLKVSQTNLEDAEFDLDGFVRERLALKFSQLEGTSFITGNAVGKPRGILSYNIKASSSYSGGSAGKNNVTDAIPYVPTGHATTITADSVLNVLMDLKTAYEANATYAMTRATLNSLRLLKDGTGQPLWTPFASGSSPKMIYGRPVVEVPDMNEIGAGNYPIVVGDFSKYMIVDRIALSLQRLQELYAASGLIGFIARKRTGGDVILPESFRLLKVATS